jgi:Holliday junction resolvase RusA-like endonuclease
VSFYRHISITPVPKPRMTQSDRWRKRDCTTRYFDFKDALRDALGDAALPQTYRLVFHLPMPPSWSRKKRAVMRGQPHQQKPDIDNLAKAVLDSLYADDAGLWDLHSVKFWADVGAIEIIETAPYTNALAAA